MSDHAHDDKEHKEHKGGHGHGGGHGGGHGDGEHEGAPEWLISFADNVTLMMGFFVVMLAATMAHVGGGGAGDGKEKGQPGNATPPNMLDAAIAVRAAFHNPVNIDSTDPTDQPLVRRLIERDIEGYSKFPGPKGKEHDVQSIRPGTYREACAKIPFENGSAKLSDEARKTVLDVSENNLRGLRFIIEIRGHASASECFDQGDKGMRLSFDRALAVADVMTKTGIEWRQLRVIANADNDRLKRQGYGKTGQRPNERVEILVTQEPMPSYTPGLEPQPVGKAATSRPSAPSQKQVNSMRNHNAN